MKCNFYSFSLYTYKPQSPFITTCLAFLYKKTNNIYTPPCVSPHKRHFHFLACPLYKLYIFSFLGENLSLSNDFNTHDNLYTPHDEHLYICTPTLSCFGSFAMHAIFWEISAKFCTIFRRFQRKIDTFYNYIFLSFARRAIFGRYRRNFAQFLGDFGKKLIPVTITSFCLLQCEQILGDFDENLHNF